MKKIALAIALFASMFAAGAQVKSESAVKKAVEAATAASENPKKALKADTWIKLGKAYIEAYDAAAGSGIVGLGKQEITLMLGSTKPTATEQVVLDGNQYTKDVFATSNYYYNANNVLAMIEVSKPYYADALDQALAAYKHAAEIDTKGSKKKDIAAALADISSKFQADAYTAYTLGDLKKAAANFEKAAETSTVPPCAKVDTLSFYNAGFINAQAGNNAEAKRLFTKCLNDYNYTNDGDVYARLATIAEQEGDKAAQKKYLEDGFSSYPQSQFILIGLINYYVSNHEDTGRLFELIDVAKKNEPTNASLHYVEGNIYKELGDTDKAVAAYRRCAEINPEYEYGYIGEGILFYNKAIEIQDAASKELDDAKYMALVKDFENALRASVDPFEKAFEICKDDALKVNICEYLKNACYRFREDDPTFQQKYDKYAAIVSAGTAQ